MSKKLTLEEFILRARLIHGNKFDYNQFIYVNSETRGYIICHELDENGVEHGGFWQKPKDHIHCKAGCKKCQYQNLEILQPILFDEFILRANKIHNNLYVYSEKDYINFSTITKIHCNIHGDFWQKPVKHCGGHKCPKCSDEHSGLIRATPIDIYLSRAKLIHKNKYTYLATIGYGLKAILLIECPLHGVFEQKLAAHLKGCSCPICNRSKGEEKIGLWLKENNIKYISQKRFKDCKDKTYLRFDIYLQDYNFLIEYDGEQHFFPVIFNRMSYKLAILKFLDTIKKDEIKNKFCIDNNIPLLRIPYWDFKNIDAILNNNLIFI